MNIPVRIGMDTSKSVFQLHGVDENEVVVVLVAIESCGSSHHWARLLQSFGHKEADPAAVREALCEARQERCDRR